MESTSHAWQRFVAEVMSVSSFTSCFTLRVGGDLIGGEAGFCCLNPAGSIGEGDLNAVGPTVAGSDRRTGP